MRHIPANSGPGTSIPREHWALKGLFWLALIWFVKSAQLFLAPVAVAVVLTFLLGPGVRALRRRGVPLAGGAAVMVGGVLLVMALVAGTLATPVSQWWARAPAMVSGVLRQVDRVRGALELGPPRTAPAALPATPPASSAGAGARADPPDPVKARIASEGLALTGSLVGSTVALLGQAGGALLLLFFLLISEHWIVSRVVEAFPQPRRRAVVLSALRSAQRDISRFFGSLGLLYGVVGVSTGLGLFALGLPNPVLWGVLTTLLSFIPYAGPVVITSMLVLAGLGSFGLVPMALAPPLLFMVLHLVEANLVSPWFVAQRLLLSPIAVFLSVLFWAWAWGVTGALIAVPMLVVLRSVCKRHPSLRLLHLLMQGRHAETPSLRALLRRRTGATRPLA